MKKQQFLFTLVGVLSIFILSCNQEQPKQEIMTGKMVCYQSISGSDTAWLSIDTTKAFITGPLTFNYSSKKEIFDGQFRGEMHGDTLKGHFDFKINKAETPLRNPVAFLKRDGKLTMGIGQFMTVIGIPHFDDRVPINYENGRFVFEEVECKK